MSESSEQSISLRKLAKEILKHHGLSAKKYLSQNFLVDRNVYKKIIAAAELSDADQVIEIGPGLGFLTTELARNAGSVVAVEIDDDLAHTLETLLPVTENLVVHNQDILTTDLEQLGGIDVTKPYKLVANIPYHITAKILKKFLTAINKPTHIVLLVQYEVAERILAQAGNHSLLSLSVQYYGMPEIVAKVSKKAFYPAPEVTSAILKITLNSEPVEQEDLFWKVARTAFSSKRKKAVNNISHSLDIDKPDLVAIFEKLNLDLGNRAQHLSIPEWKALVNEISKLHTQK